VIKAAEDEQWHNNQIQGFLYGNRHVIRDLSLTPGNQEIYSITSENYDAGHETMMAELDRIKKARIARAAIAITVKECAEVGRDAALWASGDTDASLEVKNLILTLSPKIEDESHERR